MFFSFCTCAVWGPKLFTCCIPTSMPKSCSTVVRPYYRYLATGLSLPSGCESCQSALPLKFWSKPMSWQTAGPVDLYARGVKEGPANIGPTVNCASQPFGPLPFRAKLDLHPSSFPRALVIHIQGEAKQAGSCLHWKISLPKPASPSQGESPRS